MNKENFTRNQRRQIEKLAELVDQACAADRAYFERRPDREHRLRRSFKAEIQQNELLSGGEFDARLPPGMCWHTIVKNLCNGVRLRQFVPFIEHADADLAPEANCKELFEALAARHPQIRDIERLLRETECGEGQP